ncbi:GNAT family N-acetyltransferase [Halomonas vilamensis]|uniref:GNAT family N-acetyltransferase n=1 Tax=Vreelandella vilamensis TaxID=531309 RepID=A0ABU1H663_9GAMM|nr:GNAT family N-acetyltransferase [Halomonas vilamensis]MDR5899798.1 GNAT family N-acetyltransferase [Halomonas vilamensis]
MPSLTLSSGSSPLVCTILPKIACVTASQWDRLADPDHPFLRHAYLHALEASGSVSPATGWEPAHLAVWQGQALVGALPLYRKHHSYGEYVFDWTFADALERAGGRYYPKALSAIPYTPVPGPRTLIAPESDEAKVREALAQGLWQLCDDEALSSWHLLFSARDDVAAWQALCPDLIAREGVQFQWRDGGGDTPRFGDFDGFLATLTAKRRKMIKRERRIVADQGITLHRLEGETITPEALAHFYRCYTHTYHERGRPPYLNRDFFQRIKRTMPESLLLVQARLDERPVAAALYFRGTQSLYGRYWGSEVLADCLHFEACYYQGIEYCLEQGLTLFDPGTQGEHKLVRGFHPQPLRSLHYFAHPGLAAGVARFCEEEAHHMAAYRHAASDALPFRREGKG